MNSVSMAWRIARRELRGGLRGFRVFLACLALGVGAIAAIGLVRSGIEAGLEREGATILGGDVEVELTYRFATDDELAWLQSQSIAISAIADFRSMVLVERDSGDERSLTQVKAVDDAYPLYGQVVLEPQISLEDALAGQDGRPGILVDPIIMDRLGLSIGEAVKLGATEFVVMARLIREPDSAGGGFGLGPPTIVDKTALQESGLLGQGSLFDSEYRLRVDPGTDLDALRVATEDALAGAGFQWRDRRNGAPGISRFVDRLSSFLVLVGLTGLAVGGVGVASAVRAYLQEKTTVIATLRSLGADSRVIFLAYIFQIAVLSALGIVFGLILGSLVPVLFGPIIEASLPVPAAFTVTTAPLAEAALYGALSAAIFTLWPLAQTENIRAASLFRDAAGGAGRLPRPLWIAVTFGLLAALVGVAALLSGLQELTLWVAGGICGAFLALVLTAWLIRRGASWLSRRSLLRGRPTLRSALGAVGGPGSESTSVILSLGLGLTVLAAVGQIESNLNGAIARDLPDVAPSYFVVDIQPDQLEPLKDQLRDNRAVTKVDTAPMLRGVVTQINGRPAEEVAGDHWVIQGDRGITYAAQPAANTIVTAGTWWGPDYEGPAQISFAAEEAEEMGLRLFDRLTVNILGRDIEATITSFREVDFSNAGIGFVMTMNPGALRGAPHTHIATVYANEEAEGAILRDMASAFPNITAISVRDAIDRVTLVLEGISAAVTYGALATLLTGGVVLIGTAAAGVRARIYEGAILKTLGATRSTILTNFALRSAILGLAAGALALIGGVVGGWAVMQFVMETSFQMEPVSALIIVSGGVIVTLITGAAFAWRPLAARPAQVLRARE